MIEQASSLGSGVMSIDDIHSHWKFIWDLLVVLENV